MTVDPHRQTTTNSRETLYAILISGLISIVLASLVVGNPFRAFGLAYGDYGQESTAGVNPASDVHAPVGDKPAPASQK